MPRNWSRTSTQAMSVPITTLTSGDEQRPGRRSAGCAAAVCSLVIASPEAAPAAARRRSTTTAVSGISTSRLNQIIATPSPSAGRPASGVVRAPAEPALARRPARGDRRASPVTRPCRSPRWILVTMPFSSSKNFVVGLGPAAEVVVDGEQRCSAPGTGRPGRWRPRPRRVDAVDRPGGSPSAANCVLALGAEHEVEEVLRPSGRRRSVTAPGFSMSSVVSGMM